LLEVSTSTNCTTAGRADPAIVSHLLLQWMMRLLRLLRMLLVKLLVRLLWWWVRAHGVHDLAHNVMSLRHCSPMQLVLQTADLSVQRPQLRVVVYLPSRWLLVLGDCMGVMLLMRLLMRLLVRLVRWRLLLLMLLVRDLMCVAGIRMRRAKHLSQIDWVVRSLQST
jgi:hypothetical protein